MAETTVKYTKQRLQWLIDDYNGDGATTRDEANLAKLVLNLVETGDSLRRSTGGCALSDNVDEWDDLTKELS